MTEQLVRDWLSDYAALSPVEAHTFVASLEHNSDLVLSIYAVLEGHENYQKVIIWFLLFLCVDMYLRIGNL